MDMLAQYGEDSNVHAVIQKSSTAIQDLKYNKRHGSQSFKEVARTILDLYTRMVGHDPGKVFHTIPIELQLIYALGDIHPGYVRRLSTQRNWTAVSHWYASFRTS
jgi:hypothetical protein